MVVGPREDPYLVHLPVFEGPLDLLLTLIERERLDISQVSIAQVTDQFLQYVHAMADVSADLLAEFLVMAARLIWIKSRLLLPRTEVQPEDAEDDPAEALARQLREYKHFKMAATTLRLVEEGGRRAYVRTARPKDLERRLDSEGLPVIDLLAAALAAFSQPEIEPPVSEVLAPFTLTIGDQIRLIASRTQSGEAVSFQSLLREVNTRQEAIVTLLALLELIKRRQVDALQDALFGDIIIIRTDGSPIMAPDDAGSEWENGGGTVQLPPQ